MNYLTTFVAQTVVFYIISIFGLLNPCFEVVIYSTVIDR